MVKKKMKQKNLQTIMIMKQLPGEIIVEDLQKIVQLGAAFILGKLL